MLASLGATERDVRFVLIVDGLLAGVLGAIIGAALGFGLWFWYYPHLETATAHRIDPLNLPWAAVVIGLLLAVATSVIAAAWPGRAVSKVPVVAAISGRVERAARDQKVAAPRPHLPGRRPVRAVLLRRLERRRR